MPLYLVGEGYSSALANTEHFHAGWEPPYFIAGRMQFRVSKGNYVPGTLDVAISAATEGQFGYSLQFPPTYLETNPSAGEFFLPAPLPEGWQIIVRYVHW